MSPVQRPPDLSQRQQPADVPLLRLFPAGAGALPGVRRPLKTIGTGTQRVQEELEFLFPDMETDRMDADTVSAVNTHEKILEHFQKENVPCSLAPRWLPRD